MGSCRFRGKGRTALAGEMLSFPLSWVFGCRSRLGSVNRMSGLCEHGRNVSIMSRVLPCYRHYCFIKKRRVAVIADLPECSGSPLSKHLVRLQFLVLPAKVMCTTSRQRRFMARVRHCWQNLLKENRLNFATIIKEFFTFFFLSLFGDSEGKCCHGSLTFLDSRWPQWAEFSTNSCCTCSRGGIGFCQVLFCFFCHLEIVTPDQPGLSWLPSAVLASLVFVLFFR